MIFLKSSVALIKSSVALKLAIGALALLVGMGGISAGATYHQANPGKLQAAHRVFVGTITAGGAAGFTMTTRKGLVVQIVLSAQTRIMRQGHVVPRADLRPGDVVLVQCLGISGGVANATQIRIVVLVHPHALAP